MKHPFTSIQQTLLALVTLSTTAHAQFVIQPTTEAASKDAKIYVNMPTGNFQSNLNLTPEFIAVIQFDLSAISFLNAAEISSATLSLFSTGIGQSGTTGATGGTVEIFPILNPWKENAGDPGADPLVTYDAFFGGSPTLGLGSSVATQTVSAGGVIDWDITNTVKGWKDGSLDNYGVMVRLTSGGLGDVGFADVDFAGSSNAPKLSVVPEPGATTLLGGAAILFAIRRRRTLTS